MLELILRLREVGHLSVDSPAFELGEVGLAQRIMLPDQARLVGIDHATGAVPELHAHDGRVAQHLLLHDAVERGERARVAADERVAQDGLDRPFGRDSRLVLGIADRLGFTGTAEEPHAEQADQHDGDEAAHEVPQHGFPDWVLLAPTQRSASARNARTRRLYSRGRAAKPSVCPASVIFQ